MRDREIGGHVGTAGGFPVVHMENNVIMVEAVAQQDKQIRALWESGKFTGAEIASQFGISVPTFFRRVRARSLTSA